MPRGGAERRGVSTHAERGHDAVEADKFLVAWCVCGKDPREKVIAPSAASPPVATSAWDSLGSVDIC